MDLLRRLLLGATLSRRLQPFIRALPLTAVIDALRGNMLQGQRLHQLWPQIAIMLGWMGLTFFTALKLFRWR